MKTLLLSLISAVVGGMLVLVSFPTGQLNQPPSSSDNLGSATTSVTYLPSILPIATTTGEHGNTLGSTSESGGDRRWTRLFSDFATTVSVDVYDELKVGRSATTTITEGTITTTDLTVTGSCTGCAGASTADFQDAYNNSAADASFFSADGKELIYIIADTTDPAEFIISAADQGSLQLAVGSTTNQTLFAYGAHGIGTSSPGGGLAVSATSSIFGGPAYILDHLRTSFLIATSTQNNSFGGALDVTEAATSTWTGGLSVGTGGLLSSTGITLSGGDLLLTSGKITQASGATSTIPSLSVSTNLSAVNLLVTGDLNVDTGTSTLQGATFTSLTSSGGALLSAGDLLLTNGRITLAGASTSTLPQLSVSTNLTAVNLLVTGDLNVDTGTSTLQGASFAGITTTNGVVVSGDMLLSGVLKISSTGTSTSAGTVAINSTTGTSTFANGFESSGLIWGHNAIIGGVSSTTVTAGTTTQAINCAIANTHTIIVEEDSDVIFKNCYAGYNGIIWVFAPTTDATTDNQVNWRGFADSWPNGEIASGTLIFNASTTVGYIFQGRWTLCGLTVASSSVGTAFGAIDCGENGYVTR